MVEKSSKYIINKCSHFALRLILIGKDAHRKGNIRHVGNWLQAFSSNFSCLFRSKIAKIAKDKCSRCAMDFYYCFRWLSMAPSHRIIALLVHPFTRQKGVDEQSKVIEENPEVTISDVSVDV